MNVVNNRLINISVNPNVLNSCKSVPEVQVNSFNPEVRGSLRPNGHKDPGMREWERNILVHLNSVNLIERDERKTSYVKFKLFKQDIYGLALVDTGNLVKGTLVSSEFWKKIGGKML